MAATMNSPSVSYGPRSSLLGRYRDLSSDYTLWLREFAEVVDNDPRMRGRVLDVGCGAGIVNATWRGIIQKAARVDGVDPREEIKDNPYLTDKFVGLLEDAPFEPGVYDAAFAHFVLEHVQQPRAFMAAVARALRPGGVFYAVTASRHHPFPFISRALDVTRLKYMLWSKDDGVNEYPAYYILNSARAMARATEGLGFSSIRVFRAPSVQWKQYFPSALRAFPVVYDYCLGCRMEWASLTRLFQVEKAS